MSKASRIMGYHRDRFCGVRRASEAGDFVTVWIRASGAIYVSNGSLPDRGTDSCVRNDEHPYQLSSGRDDSGHSRTKVESLLSKGFCGRFHKTALQEFHQLAFRKELYTGPKKLQNNLDSSLLIRGRVFAVPASPC